MKIFFIILTLIFNSSAFAEDDLSPEQKFLLSKLKTPPYIEDTRGDEIIRTKYQILNTLDEEGRPSTKVTKIEAKYPKGSQSKYQLQNVTQVESSEVKPHLAKIVNYFIQLQVKELAAGKNHSLDGPTDERLQSIIHSTLSSVGNIREKPARELLENLKKNDLLPKDEGIKKKLSNVAYKTKETFAQITRKISASSQKTSPSESVSSASDPGLITSEHGHSISKKISTDTDSSSDSHSSHSSDSSPRSNTDSSDQATLKKLIQDNLNKIEKAKPNPSSPTLYNPDSLVTSRGDRKTDIEKLVDQTFKDVTDPIYNPKRYHKGLSIGTSAPEMRAKKINSITGMLNRAATNDEEIRTLAHYLHDQAFSDSESEDSSPSTRLRDFLNLIEVYDRVGGHKNKEKIDKLREAVYAIAADRLKKEAQGAGDFLFDIGEKSTMTALKMKEVIAGRRREIFKRYTSVKNLAARNGKDIQTSIAATAALSAQDIALFLNQPIEKEKIPGELAAYSISERKKYFDPTYASGHLTMFKAYTGQSAIEILNNAIKERMALEQTCSQISTNAKQTIVKSAAVSGLTTMLLYYLAMTQLDDPNTLKPKDYLTASLVTTMAVSNSGLLGGLKTIAYDIHPEIIKTLRELGYANLSLDDVKILLTSQIESIIAEYMLDGNPDYYKYRDGTYHLVPEPECQTPNNESETFSQILKLASSVKEIAVTQAKTAALAACKTLNNAASSLGVSPGGAPIDPKDE